MTLQGTLDCIRGGSSLKHLPPMRHVLSQIRGQGMTLRSLSVCAFTDPVEYQARFAIHRPGTLNARAASGRVSDWSERRGASAGKGEVEPSFEHKSSTRLAHDYKLKAKERILYQQRVTGAHSELKMNIWVARRLLAESLELLNRLDASLARSWP
jgi:hypothetical protein